VPVPATVNLTVATNEAPLTPPIRLIPILTEPPPPEIAPGTVQAGPGVTLEKVSIEDG
jgi:hypothetical protein